MQDLQITRLTHFNEREHPPDPSHVIENGSVISPEEILNKRVIVASPKRRKIRSPTPSPSLRIGKSNFLIRNPGSLDIESPSDILKTIKKSPLKHPKKLTPPISINIPSERSMSNIFLPLSNTVDVPIIDVKPIGSIIPDSPISQNIKTPVKDDRPNYMSMTEEEQMSAKVQFHTKFRILRSNFPTWNISDPPEGSSLNQIHDLYEGYVRQIMVSINCNQYKVYLVIFFLAFEVFGIKYLGLDMRGYTMSQVRLMNRYNRVLIELGEKYYAQGGSNWPVEARIAMIAGINAIVFIAVKYLVKWLGLNGEMADHIQNAIDNLLGSDKLFENNGPEKDQFGISVPPAEENASGDNDSNPLGLISGLLGGLMGKKGSGNKGDISSMLASVGDKITSGMKPKNADAPRKMPKFKS